NVGRGGAAPLASLWAGRRCIEDNTQQLVSDSELHSKRIDTLWNRVEDLENRSRHNNVRLLGLKEGTEGHNIKACIGKILSEGQGMDVGDVTHSKS
ncbi:hypothetical protein NQZ68_030689, partial [Dissostichus eleginoides]